MTSSPPSGTKQAVLYIRVSTEDQLDNYSLETQESICIREAERLGIPVMRIFREEGKSAKTIKGRPALIEMLEFCRKNKKQVEAVIAYRLDRIARETADYLAIRRRLSEYGVRLLSATEPTGDSPTERLLETILAGFAQMDNEVRAERSRNGMRARFLSGLPNACVPRGYVVLEGYPIKDLASFDHMLAAWNLVATGTKSLREIGDFLFGLGVRQKGSGKRMSVQTLDRIFHNRFYVGKVVSPKYGLEVQGQHPPMVSEELFNRVQEILTTRNPQASRQLVRHVKDNPDFRMRRLVRCGQCGSSLTGGWSTGKIKKYAYYSCLKHCGSRPSIPRALLEAETFRYLEKVRCTSQAYELFLFLARSAYQKRTSYLSQRQREVSGRIESLGKMRQALAEKNLAGIYSDELFTEQNQLLDRRIEAAKKIQQDNLLGKYTSEGAVTFVGNKISSLALTYKEADLVQVRLLIKSIFPLGLSWEHPGYSNIRMSPFYSRRSRS